MSQRTNVLPREVWQDIVIRENNESLVEILQTNKIKRAQVGKEGPVYFFVRKSVAEKLEQLSRNLPDGINLAIIEGYRSIDSQQKSWDRSYIALREENPSWSDKEIEDKVKLVVAQPHPLANHHCGGAVDLTLSYNDGVLLDMGSPYPSVGYGMEIRKKFPMFSSDITEKQKQNRKILREAMVKTGFVWYPGEWWHYCYGDRMWAVYLGQKECFYGPIEFNP